MNSQKKIITCVITDLDDTVWDWFKMWHNSFEPYIKSISKECKIDLDILKSDFKKLHNKYYTSESSFAYRELDCLSEKHIKIIEKEKKDSKSVIHSYYSNKKHELKMYGSVLDTLEKLKKKGVLVIGYTESNAFFTKYRLKHLQLDGLFDCIYTPIGAGMPESITRYYKEQYWEPKFTKIRHLSIYDKKPNKEILEIILKDFSLKKDETIYIGDKLDRDIQMAIDVGVSSVYAQYGDESASQNYELLKEVTHWSDDDVKREIEFNNKFKLKTISPNFTLEKSYSEIFNHFDFASNENKLVISENIETLLPNVLRAWEKIIDVQMHFNEIALKIRNLALTTFTFILLGIGFLFTNNLSGQIDIWGFELNLIALFSVSGALLLWGFSFMDKKWYHQFLKGAVSQGLKIEEKWRNIIPEIGLTNNISEKSNYDTQFLKICGLKILKYKSNSEKRFKFYYYPFIFSLLIFGAIAQFKNKPFLIDKELYDKSISELENKDIEIQSLRDEIILIKKEKNSKEKINK